MADAHVSNSCSLSSESHEFQTRLDLAYRIEQLGSSRFTSPGSAPEEHSHECVVVHRTQQGLTISLPISRGRGIGCPGYADRFGALRLESEARTLLFQIHYGGNATIPVASRKLSPVPN